MAEGNPGQAPGKVVSPLKGGGFVAFDVRTTPPGPQNLPMSLANVESNIVHRVFIDEKNRLCFGYDLRIEPLQTDRKFRLVIDPIAEDYVQRLRAMPSLGAISPHPGSNPNSIAQFRGPQILNDGDSLVIDVLENPTNGTRISDVITVTFFESRLRTAAKQEQPRDFSIDDMELSVNNYRLLLNGNVIWGPPSGGCSGTIIWFYLPGRGRFVFSLIPREGLDFKKTGVIEHNKISFSLDGEHYEWISSSPVLAIDGIWNLWVLHDQLPKELFRFVGAVTIGAADGPQFLHRK